MRHRVATDEIRELAAAYSLGALEPEEAIAFEAHLAQSCRVCRAELGGFDATVSALALSAVEQQPSFDARPRLFARLNGGYAHDEGDLLRPSGSQFLSIRGAEGEWQELCNGVLFKLLYVDDASGLATSLVKMAPGTSLPRHRHRGVEQFFVIEGDCRVQGEKLGPGDFHRAEAGSIHESTYTVDGTMFLLMASEGYEVLEAR
jgi:anti-sigma factor ChrR (cupin superfamily)